jgi:Zn-dependent protease with chaperone function
VKRRPVGRKASLTLRMAFVLLAVLALYAAVVVAVVWVAGHGTGWAIGVAVVGFVLMTALVSQLWGSGGFYFRALNIDVEPASPELNARPVQALCIVPPSLPRFELLMDHPPLDKRIAALAEIARDLGEPVRS